MPGDDPNPDPNTPGLAYATLKRIAELLGVPVEALMEEQLPAAYGDAAQLFRLWQRIESSKDRQFVLNLLRKLAEGEDDPRPPQPRGE